MASDVERIPATNLHVPLDQFVAVWKTVERLSISGDGGWYAVGVLETCRWLACAIVRRDSGGREPAYAPVTNGTSMAIAELIEAESLRADVLAMRRPVPNWLQRRPGWIDGVCATLAWAWRASGPPPVDLASHAS